ncbi:MAG: hypothetical protein KKB51_11425, partial [Candidatus Riflebacteria bacterium]|nr:hypothetical protein [Candidatus Riflebacteria bacterium]
ADDLMLQMQTYGQKQELKDEVIALSKEYQFATPFTSFVAVSTTPVPQVSQRAATHSSASNLSTMARATNRSNMAVNNSGGGTRTIVRRTEAKSLSLWGATGFLPIAAIAIPNFRKARQQSRQKACFANQRVLMGAIEMYNMDNNVMIDVMTPEVMDLLVQGKYLKSPIVPAEQDCCFGTIDDLSKSGIVICAVHGSIEDPIIDSSSADAKAIVSQATFYDASTNSLIPGTVTTVEIRYENETWFTRIWNSWLADAVNLLINVPLFIIGLVFSLYIMYYILSLPFKIIAGISNFFTDKES